MQTPCTWIVSCLRRFAPALVVVLATMAPPLVPSAGAQLAPEKPQRVQIAGTRVTLVPARGLKSPPGAAILVRQDGLSVMVKEQKVDTIEAGAKLLLSPDFQRLNQLSDVEISLRPRGAVKRVFIKMWVTEKVGVQHRRIVAIDDGRSAVMVMANVPKKAFDADPSLAAAMDQMLETVSFTEKELAFPYSFKITPPPGYRPMTTGGQMQMFGAGEREFIVAIRLERPVAPAAISQMADFVIPRTLDSDFNQLETLSESRARSGEWEYYEREFKGISKRLGAAIEGLVRLQTNAANESYVLFAVATPPLSDGMKARMRAAFESIRATGSSPAGAKAREKPVAGREKSR